MAIHSNGGHKRQAGLIASRPEPIRGADLAAALERGEPRAVLAITRLITGFLMRAGAYHMRQSWEDLCQEVITALIQSARSGGLRETEAFVGYVAAITRNKLADWRRRARGERLDPAYEVEPLAMLRDVDLLMDVRHALRALPEREQRVIEALYLNGYSYGEAAKRLDMPLGTLKRLQTAGLRAMRKHLLVAPRRAESR